MHMDDVGHSKAAVHLAMLINLLSIGSLMMVMPLGPDLVRHLGMQASHVGYISGGATLASALSMALAAPWLDRLKRKQALVILLTLRFSLLMACSMTSSAEQLILLFVLSGLVAGPMGALLMASMLDIIPPAERGRKLAYIGMGFSLAAIVVVPLALELALRGVITREDLAEQSIDDLLDIDGIDEERAGKLIMAARAHWFE